jgi:acyl-CoA thioesterase I
MLRSIILILTLSAASVLAEAPRILVVGDSLSAGFGLALEDGWVTLLQARLDESGYGYEVINASISGDTTQGGRARMPRALALHQPEIVIIELGGNDGLRGIPVPVLRDNLLEMVRQASAAGAQVLLLGVEIPMNYGAVYRDAFRQSYPMVAQGTGATVVASFMDGVAMDESLMQPDGIHPNAAGQPRLLANVWPALTALLEPGTGASEP